MYNFRIPGISGAFPPDLPFNLFNPFNPFVLASCPDIRAGFAVAGIAE
jgi:hypothetical protein